MNSVASDPMESLPLRSAVDVCAFVDTLPADAAGELRFPGVGTPPTGVVFVEGGRICWAAARGLARRLSDLLAASAKLDPAKMESYYQTCKEQGAPLGEYLVKAGVVTSSELRGALLAHSAASLHTMCVAAGTSAQWVPKHCGGYSSQFTFTTTELLARTFAETHGELAVQAREELREAFGKDDWGAAFVRSAARATPDPVAVHGAPPDRIAGLLRLASWASSSLDVTSLAHDERAFIATVLESGAALVAWRSGSVIIAGSTDATGPARLLNRRARARREQERRGRI